METTAQATLMQTVIKRVFSQILEPDHDHSKTNKLQVTNYLMSECQPAWIFAYKNIEYVKGMYFICPMLPNISHLSIDWTAIVSANKQISIFKYLGNCKYSVYW